jgi:putative toxin-antitoxin system antitoxin component (TIGR02293 family)
MKRYLFMQDPILRYEAAEQPTLQEMQLRIEKGLPYSVFEELSQTLPLTNKEWSAILALSDRTLQRWFNDQPRIDGLTAERLFEIARLTAVALDVFTTGSDVVEWLRTPHPDFDNEAPIRLLKTQAGIDLVKSLLLRIMHGVVA